MVKWIRTSRLSIKNSLSLQVDRGREAALKRYYTSRLEQLQVNGIALFMEREGCYRGTSPIRNIAPLGPCSRAVSRALWWS